MRGQRVIRVTKGNKGRRVGNIQRFGPAHAFSARGTGNIAGVLRKSGVLRRANYNACLLAGDLTRGH
jgi:hypothetical protein